MPRFDVKCPIWVSVVAYFWDIDDHPGGLVERRQIEL